jgi:hypothetical protein
LERVTLPPSLQTLTFGHFFNQNLERVTLPPNLQTLTFGHCFNQSLERVTLPSSLQPLTFGWCKIEHIFFGIGFEPDYPDLEGVLLPSSLKTLGWRKAVLSCS